MSMLIEDKRIGVAIGRGHRTKSYELVKYHCSKCLNTVLVVSDYKPDVCRYCNTPSDRKEKK